MSCILVFLIFAEYTEKFIVKGYLDSKKGMVRIYPSRVGFIMGSTIYQGKKIKKGDELFLINTTIYDELNKEIFRKLSDRKNSIDKEIIYHDKHLHDLQDLLKKNTFRKSSMINSEKH